MKKKIIIYDSISFLVPYIRLSFELTKNNKNIADAGVKGTVLVPSWPCCFVLIMECALSWWVLSTFSWRLLG